MVQCMSNRDSIIYFVDILRQHAEKALDILADTIFNPVLAEEEIEEIKSIIQFQNEDLPAETLSREAAQMASFPGYSLGNSHHCPLDRLDEVNRSTLLEFRSKHFFGENCFLAAAGIDHESFARLAEEKFSSMPSKRTVRKASEGRSVSKFVGGMVTNERKLKEPFVKVAICFEAGKGWTDEYLVPMCVLQILLGGGKSFSAGGPGKGLSYGDL